MQNAESIKSALVVLVPEAEPLVRDFRSRFDLSGIAGLGAHVTVLFPFRSVESLPSSDVEVLKGVFAAHPPLRFTLRDIRTFPSVVYLAPSPAAPLNALTRAVTAAFPDYLPYGGQFAELTPHLTVAQQPPAEDLDGVRKQLESKAAGVLPIECAVGEVLWVLKQNGQWLVGQRFALGGA